MTEILLLIGIAIGTQAALDDAPAADQVAQAENLPAFDPSSAAGEIGAKFERIGYRKTGGARWFTVYVKNPTRKEIMAYVKKDGQQYAKFGNRLLWYDFFDDRRATPDHTLTGKLTTASLKHRVASYRFNPFRPFKDETGKTFYATCNFYGVLKNK